MSHKLTAWLAAAVETALFCQDHPIVEAEGVDHGGAHAA